MGLYVLTCMDRADAGGLRAETRQRHLDYLEKAGAAVRLAGALLDPTGERPVGSMLLIEAADPRTVEAFAEADPYAVAGLFASVDVKPWRQAVGKLG